MARIGQDLAPVQGGGVVGFQGVGARPAVVVQGGARQPRAPRQPRVQGGGAAAGGVCGGNGTAVNEVTPKNVRTTSLKQFTRSTGMMPRTKSENPSTEVEMIRAL